MGGARTKMDENSEYASGRVSIHSVLSTQHSALFSQEVHYVIRPAVGATLHLFTHPQ